METITRGNPPRALGNTVREHREAAGWSLRGLARASGVSHTMIWLVENGHRSFGVRSIVKLSPFLGDTFTKDVMEVMAHDGVA